jgi:2,5-diketo-D-gluconate reductase A
MTVPLGDGVSIPQVGFGVYLVPPAQTEAAVRTALDAGYRSIDTAAMYGNEREVGRAIRGARIPRDAVFVTTKLNNPNHGYDSALRAFDASLAALGMDRLDLYLIHWPQPRRNRYVETWRALIRLKSDGRVRAIGVANFQPAHLERLLAETGVLPAINQVELHPYLAQPRLRAFHAEHGIVTEAWGPLARGGALLRDPVLTGLAAKYGRTPAQVVLRWHLQLRNVVIPKSVTPARVAENIALFDFQLADADMATINALDRRRRTGPNPDTNG